MSQTEYSIQLENISAKLQESFKFKFDNSEKQIVWSKMFWTYLSHQTFCDALDRINSLALSKKLTFEEKSLSNYDMLALLRLSIFLFLGDPETYLQFLYKNLKEYT